MKRVVVTLVLGIGFYTSSAMAWHAYYLGNNKWAIECNDGHMYSYSGSGAGLPLVGNALCPSGLAGPGSGKPVGKPAQASGMRKTYPPAPPHIRAVVEGENGKGCTPVLLPHELPGRVMDCGKSGHVGRGIEKTDIRRGMGH